MQTHTRLITGRELELLKNLAYRHAQDFDRPHDPDSRDFTRAVYEKLRNAETIVVVSSVGCACSEA